MKLEKTLTAVINVEGRVFTKVNVCHDRQHQHHRVSRTTGSIPPGNSVLALHNAAHWHISTMNVASERRPQPTHLHRLHATQLLEDPFVEQPSAGARR